MERWRGRDKEQRCFGTENQSEKHFSSSAVMNKFTFTLPPPVMFLCLRPLFIHPSLLSSYHPSTLCFWSSEMPKDSDPMKSLRLVRSQSHTSTDRRRSLSYSFRWLSGGDEDNQLLDDGWEWKAFFKLRYMTAALFLLILSIISNN